MVGRLATKGRKMDLSFVSSASELIEQFQRVHSDEAVHYELWLPLPREGSATAARERAHHLIREVLQLVRTKTKDYLWEFDDFNLCLHALDAVEHRLCLRGRTRFGENIEDEWLIVWLLFEVSRAFPELMIQVWDNDGQFLLIEASHALPVWVRPENTENRVWLKGGVVHLLRPTPEQLRQHKRGKGLAGLSIDQAIGMMVGSSADHVADGIQQAIEERTSQFPAQLQESMHRAACIMPYAIARIIDKHPPSVSLAVRAFGDRKQEEVAAIARKRYDAEPFVAVQVQLSKWQYAQLMFHQIHPSKSFSAAAARVSNDADGLKASELGNKLVCGYEILTRRNEGLAQHDQSVEGSVQEQAWKHYLKKLQSMNYFANEMEGSKAYKDKLSAAKAFFRQQQADSGAAEDSITGPSTADQMLYNVCELVQQPIDPTAQLSIAIDPATLADATDDDAWMHTAPSDFEEEMQRIASKMSVDLRVSDGTASSGADPSNLSKDLGALQSIVAGFTNFMTGTSGHEGAEPQIKPARVADFSAFDPTKFEATLRNRAGYAIQNGKLKRTSEVDHLNEVEAISGDTKHDDGAKDNSNDEYFSDDDYDQDDEQDSDDEEDGPEQEVSSAAAASTPTASTRKVRFADEEASAAAARPSETPHSVATGVGFISDTADGDGDEDGDGEVDSDDESAADSDDEPAAVTGNQAQQRREDTFDDDEEFMEQYMAAMDAQLLGTSMEQSFEQRRRQPGNKRASGKADDASNEDDLREEDEDGVDSEHGLDSDDEMPVDVDANLLKYLLESFNAQMGQSGPASNLMRELGLDIPISSAVELEIDDDASTSTRRR